MIITKQALQQLIDEEFQRALARRRTVKEAYAGHSLSDVDLDDLLDFAKAYADLGDLRDQLDVILAGDERRYHADVSSGGVALIKRELGGKIEAIDEAIAAYEDWFKMKSSDEEEDEDDGSWEYAAKVNGIR